MTLLPMTSWGPKDETKIVTSSIVDGILLYWVHESPPDSHLPIFWSPDTRKANMANPHEIIENVHLFPISESQKKTCGLVGDLHLAMGPYNGTVSYFKGGNSTHCPKMLRQNLRRPSKQARMQLVKGANHRMPQRLVIPSVAKKICRHSHILYTYILTFYLALSLTFELTYMLTFYLAFYFTFQQYVLTMFSGILPDIYSDISYDIQFDIRSDICFDI